jgi:hypothetical protein
MIAIANKLQILVTEKSAITPIKRKKDKNSETL